MILPTSPSRRPPVRARRVRLPVPCPPPPNRRRRRLPLPGLSAHASNLPASILSPPCPSPSAYTCGCSSFCRAKIILTGDAATNLTVHQISAILLALTRPRKRNSSSSLVARRSSLVAILVEQKGQKKQANKQTWKSKNTGSTTTRLALNLPIAQRHRSSRKVVQPWLLQGSSLSRCDKQFDPTRKHAAW